MENNKKNLLDIDKEIKLKRYNPDYLATYFESIIENLDKKYGYDFQEVSDYGKNFETWKWKLSQPKKKSDDLINKMSEINRLAKDVLKEKKLDSHKSKKLDKLLNDFNNSNDLFIFDDTEWRNNLDEATKLTITREKILSKRRISTMVSFIRLRYKVWQIFSNIIVFCISFALSYYIGKYFEINIVEIFGVMLSQLGIALLLFLILDFTLFDKIVRKVEELLKWKIVKKLYIRLQKLSVKIYVEKKFQNNVENIFNEKTRN